MKKKIELTAEEKALVAIHRVMTQEQIEKLSEEVRKILADAINKSVGM